MNIVEFEENSEMEIIDYSDFSNSSIQKINIPPNCHVKPDAFYNCPSYI